MASKVGPLDAQKVVGPWRLGLHFNEAVDEKWYSKLV
jgi:hypothetical protein